jgi:surface carbohydrate biosynthesis protein
VSGLVDCYLAWGEQGHRALLENGLMREEQIQTVGCPRFDFYSPPYTSMIGDRATFLAGLGVKDVTSPVILWAPPNVAHAAVGSDAVTRWRAGTNVDPSIFKEEMEDALDQYREHSPLIVELARRRSAWTVIVKVHPSDQLSRFLWMRESAASIYVVQAAPIRELLNHCDVLLQRCSTSANEAWLLGKPVLSLGTEREALRISPSYAAGNETVRTLDEIVGAVDRFLKEPRISEDQERARDAFIEETYFRVDGKCSERCARRIDELVSPPHHTDADQERIRETARIVAAEFERDDINRTTRRLKAMIGIKPGRSLRFWRRASDAADSVSASTTEVKVDDLYAQFARLHGVACVKPGPRPSGGVSSRSRARATAGRTKE